MVMKQFMEKNPFINNERSRLDSAHVKMVYYHCVLQTWGGGGGGEE